MRLKYTHAPASVVLVHHFPTYLSLRPTGQAQPNFIGSIIWVSERLPQVLGQIGNRTLVSMAADSSHMVKWEKRRHHVFSKVFDWILFVLAGNDDMHKSLNELEIQPGPTIDCGISCP